MLRVHALFDGRSGDRFGVRVGDDVVLTSCVVLDTGTRITCPDLPGLDTIVVIDTENFIKVIADRHGGTILGATALCAEGAEVVQLFVKLMNAGATIRTMLDAVHVHLNIRRGGQERCRGDRAVRVAAGRNRRC